MMRLIRIFSLVFLLLYSQSCFKDLGNYDYADSPEVGFSSIADVQFGFVAGEEFEIEAPLQLPEEVDNVDEVFDVEWYVDSKHVNTGYSWKYTFEKGGNYNLVIIVNNKETGERYISDSFDIAVKNQFDWGWMFLTDQGDGKSSLSFITPLNLKAFHNIESIAGGDLGSGPINLDYYYVLGSIGGSYVSGKPKVLINQQSGSVTLDGNTLQQDMWLRDEFASGQEPMGFEMMDMASKDAYYVLCSQDGDVYIRVVGRKDSHIPYYGKYNSSPYEFIGGAKISAVGTFHNNTYWCANEDRVLLFDELNSRFIGITAGGYGDGYKPTIQYYRTYDKDFDLPADVLPVDNMGMGTKCLAIGAYELIEKEEHGGLFFKPNYVSLIDRGGVGDYFIHEFFVDEADDDGSHLIRNSSQYSFSGGELLTEESVIKMSSNFMKNPYFYFTDGGNNIYVYHIKSKTHTLLYEAKNKITHIGASPIVCEFSEYGGNVDDPNYRLVIAQEGGNVSVLDVAQTKMISLFEGGSPKIELANISGFGDVKGVVWCTNYQGEY